MISILRGTKFLLMRKTNSVTVKYGEYSGAYKGIEAEHLTQFSKSHSDPVSLI